MYHILYNPLACSGKGEENAKKLKDFYKDEEIEFTDVTSLTSETCKDYMANIKSGDSLVICGGDGTLNRAINEIGLTGRDHDIYYYATGTGNDFMNDIKEDASNKPVLIDKYIEYLPKVEVNGMTKKFINNVGFGIDGYCTEVGDELAAQNVKDINYSGIAIKGLLGKFKPANAKVVIDGHEMEFKKAWLAPTMNGRFYGGGMMPTPDQDRLNKDHEVSLFVWYGSGKLRTLMAFPSIFKGEHLKHDKMCKVFTGHDITVTFDKPCPLQIDGETVKNVTTYKVSSPAAAAAGSIPNTFAAKTINFEAAM